MKELKKYFYELFIQIIDFRNKIMNLKNYPLNNKFIFDSQIIIKKNIKFLNHSL
jgi:hypothetical protein